MNSKFKGIIFMILSSASFATMNLFSKLAEGVNSYQKTFLTNVVATVIVCFILWRKKGSFLGKKESRKYLFSRGIAGTLAILTNYYALDKMFLSDATILTKLAPFFTIIFSYLLISEKITKRQATLLIVAFLGSLFVIKPQFSTAVIPALIGVASAGFAGFAYTMIRVLGNKEDFWTIILSFTGIATIVMLPSMFFNTENLTTSNVLFLMGAGVAFTLGQVALTIAYKNAPASEISMYDYIGLIIAALYGFAFFREIPDLLSFLGYVIIIGASILNILGNKKSSKEITEEKITSELIEEDLSI
ncbi:DMT family transporter [Clostridium sp.]|uniref:DMT family transporter n=1 Tax=Clostridium sp. TaxID=1506 RepID=UPI0026281817|nr:DMT family transporter [Clostridium sp.]